MKFASCAERADKGEMPVSGVCNTQFRPFSSYLTYGYGEYGYSGTSIHITGCEKYPHTITSAYVPSFLLPPGFRSWPVSF